MFSDGSQSNPIKAVVIFYNLLLFKWNLPFNLLFLYVRYISNIFPIQRLVNIIGKWNQVRLSGKTEVEWRTGVVFSDAAVVVGRLRLFQDERAGGASFGQRRTGAADAQVGVRFLRRRVRQRALFDFKRHTQINSSVGSDSWCLGTLQKLRYQQSDVPGQQSGLRRCWACSVRSRRWGARDWTAAADGAAAAAACRSSWRVPCCCCWPCCCCDCAAASDGEWKRSSMLDLEWSPGHQSHPSFLFQCFPILYRFDAWHDLVPSSPAVAVAVDDGALRRVQWIDHHRRSIRTTWPNARPTSCTECGVIFHSKKKNIGIRT